MKNSMSAVLFLAAAGIAGAQTPAPAPAAVLPPAAPPAVVNVPSGIKIGVIQAELAMVQTRDGQAAQAAMHKKFDPRAEELQKQKQDIDDLQSKLERGGTTMAQAAKDEIQRQITTKTRNLQREAQDLQDEQTAEENKVLADLEEKMKAVIQKYAVDNGIALILNVASENTPVLYIATSLDITQAIIEAYDRTYGGPKASTPVRPPAPAGAKPQGPVAPAPPKSPAATPPKP
ncbi:MAG TPA: OmpH family outer membrane protein [Bryobacteraceae bacterium]